MIKVGDRVFFKNDHEGVGYVVKISEKESCWGETFRTYLIANKARNCEPWHIMAHYDYEFRCNVVCCDEDQVWD